MEAHDHSRFITWVICSSLSAKIVAENMTARARSSSGLYFFGMKMDGLRVIWRPKLLMKKRPVRIFGQVESQEDAKKLPKRKCQHRVRLPRSRSDQWARVRSPRRGRPLRYFHSTLGSSAYRNPVPEGPSRWSVGNIPREIESLRLQGYLPCNGTFVGNIHRGPHHGRWEILTRQRGDDASGHLWWEWKLSLLSNGASVCWLLRTIRG